MTLPVCGKFAVVGGLLMQGLFYSRAVQGALTGLELDGNTGNGFEAVYDDVLNVSWLANANLAVTEDFGQTGIQSDGKMNWSVAVDYVSAMNEYNNNNGYLGINYWRLPDITPLDGNTFNLLTTDNGASDKSHNLSAPVSENYNPNGQSPDFTGSELAYHYYNNFAANARCNNNGCVPPGEYGIEAANSNNLQLFSNLRGNTYWSGAEVDISGQANAIIFAMGSGFQFTGTINNGPSLNVWVVADGNVAASTVPVPAAAWLFISAFGSLTLLKLRSAS